MPLVQYNDLWNESKNKKFNNTVAKMLCFRLSSPFRHNRFKYISHPSVRNNTKKKSKIVTKVKLFLSGCKW